MKTAPKSVAKLMVLTNNDPISAETEAIQSRIRQRAFELSQTRSHHGRELDDWIAAESEVMSVPPVKLIEKTGSFEARFALAGIHPEDVNVMVAPDQIVIKGEHNEDRESDEGTVHFSDFKSMTVFRSVTLPHPIDTKSAKVDFEHGILRVTVQKKAGPQPVKPALKKRAAPARKAPAKKSARAPKAKF